MRKLFAFIAAFLVLSESVIAAEFYELYVASNDEQDSHTSELAGSQMGASLATGDFNGDGVDDLLIGAPFASIGAKIWAGSVSIVFGESPQVSTKKITFFGENKLDQFGTAVTAGDYNNDGIDDIVIGSYNALKGDIRPGRVDILNGNLSLGTQTREYLIFQPETSLTGQVDGDGFGLSLSTIDINDDDVDDLLVGAPFAKKTGMVYGYSGGDNGIDNDMSAAYYGQIEGERFGSVISGGDIDGDKKNELVIGAYFAGTDDLKQAGRIYIYDAIAVLTGDFLKPEFSIDGKANREWFGFDLAVGDVNGDGVDDIAVGSFPYGGQLSDGKISLYYGKEALKKNPGLIINDAPSQIALGSRIYIDDLDNDGTGDLIIGAPGVGSPASSREGDVYILLGKNTTNTIYSVKEQELTSVIHGENADDWFGYSINVLDLNNDGLKDIAVGSRYSEGDDGINNGKTFIIYGDGMPFGKKRETTIHPVGAVGRGEFVSIVIEKFDLKNKKSTLIDQCYEHKDFCLFNFMAASHFDGIKLEPEIILYPDISPTSKYYEDVTVGTMLGMINGYLDEQNTPFRPEASISRIQALKVMLSAADLVPQKYQFELVDILGSLEEIKNQSTYFSDVDPKISHMWWYPRYVNFAVESGIIEKEDLFRPDDPISMQELNLWIERTSEVIKRQNEEVNS